MGASTQNDDQEPISQINVVPFVDIVLVVLIIFMVTTPIIMKPSLNIELPKAGNSESSEAGSFVISIDAAGQVQLNGSPTNEAAIAAQAQSLSSNNPLAQATISADKDVPHGRVIAIMDAIKSGGIKKFAISTDRK